MPPQTTWRLPPDRLELGASDVHIWRTSLERPPDSVAQFRQLLSPDELDKADRYHFEKDRRHYTVARGVLRMLLSRYLALAPDKLQFSYSKYGKPALEPSTGAPLKFNLAHSGGIALYAFTTVGEVGIDVELIRPDFTGDEIARRFFSTAEITALNKLPAGARHQAFFACWSRKEAFIKAKGLGLSLGLDKFDVSLTPGEPPAMLRTAWDDREVSLWSLLGIDVGEQHAAAVALAAHDWQASYWKYE